MQNILVFARRCIKGVPRISRSSDWDKKTVYRDEVHIATQDEQVLITDSLQLVKRANERRRIRGVRQASMCHGQFITSENCFRTNDP